MRLVSLALLMVCLLPGLAPGGSGTGQNAWIQEAEVFLTELFTIDGHAEEIPMERRADYLEERFGLLSGLFEPLQLSVLFPYMAGSAMALGVGIGFFVSFFTIRRHLKV